MRRYRCLCPANSFLSREGNDHEYQHGEPMCWVNDHRHPPNSTKTLAHHNISACSTRSDWVRYGIIPVWHWKGHSLEGIAGWTAPHRTRSTGGLMKASWYLRQLPSLLPVMDPKLKETWLLTVTRCGRLKWQIQRSPLLRNWRHYLQHTLPLFNTCIALIIKR